MGRNHFLIYCDRLLIDRVVDLILASDINIKLIAKKEINVIPIDDSADVYLLERGQERVRLAMIVGERTSRVGPYEGEYWIDISGHPKGALGGNVSLATDISELLLSQGARDHRRRGD